MLSLRVKISVNKAKKCYFEDHWLKMKQNRHPSMWTQVSCEGRRQMSKHRNPCQHTLHPHAKVQSTRPTHNEKHNKPTHVEKSTCRVQNTMKCEHRCPHLQRHMEYGEIDHTKHEVRFSCGGKVNQAIFCIYLLSRAFV